MVTPMIDETKLTVTRQRLAKFLGVDRKTILNLERSGYLHPDTDGKYNLQKAVANFIHYVKTRKTSQRMADDAKIRRLKIEEMQLKNQKKFDELYDEVAKAMTQEWFKNRSYIDQVPAQYTRDVKERRKIEDLLHAAYGRIVKDAEARMAARNGGTK
jgi:DNA-binding XRE family transcriptional regulator